VFDSALRSALAPALVAATRPLARAGVRPAALTLAGLAAGAGACTAAALAAWPLALGLWLLNRLLDGLDGALARTTGASDRGGFLDVVCDFAVYGGFVLAVAVARPEARLACCALLLSYYVSGTAFLAWSSLAERRRLASGDERSLRFPGGLAEGAETALVYVLFCLLPGSAEEIAWAFAGAVALTAAQRVLLASRTLA
jgi:phosphatidylglycerophosphate synthase